MSAVSQWLFFCLMLCSRKVPSHQSMKKYFKFVWHSFSSILLVIYTGFSWALINTLAYSWLTCPMLCKNVWHWSEKHLWICLMLWKTFCEHLINSSCQPCRNKPEKDNLLLGHKTYKILLYWQSIWIHIHSSLSLVILLLAALLALPALPLAYNCFCWSGL